MSMSVIFHDNSGLVSRLIVIDNDEISTEVLSIDDLLRELASSSSLHEEDDPAA